MRILIGVLIVLTGMLLSIDPEPHTYAVSSSVQTNKPIIRHYYPPEP